MSDYSHNQIRIPSVTPSGNADVANGWSSLWGHHQSKLVYDGTYFYAILVTQESSSSTPNNFRIYRVDTRQTNAVVAPLSFKLNQVYQGPVLLIDRDSRLHVFYIETDTDNAVLGTTRTIRHYRSAVSAGLLTNSSITATPSEWTLVQSFTHPGVMHGYLSASYDYYTNTLYLAYNDDDADLLLLRNPGQAGWTAAMTVQASSASHEGGELYRALYAHIVPFGQNAADLYWLRAYNQGNYDQVLYRRITDVDAGTMDALLTVLDRSPGGPADPLLVSNPYIFASADGRVHAVYWTSDGNDHFITSRVGSGAFGTAVSITGVDPQSRGYRQYGVLMDQRFPPRLHAFLSPAQVSAPDNGLAQFRSEDDGASWDFEQDYLPPLASTTADDYPDIIHTFNNRDGAQDNRIVSAVLYNGLNTIGSDTQRVILEIFSYSVEDTDYISQYDPQDILLSLIDSEWRTHFNNIPKPRMFAYDSDLEQRISASDSDFIIFKAGSDYSEEQIGYLLAFRNIKAPVEIEIYTKHSRQRLLDIFREIERIIYKNQINFLQIGNFHRLMYKGFVQRMDEEEKIWHGLITCELQADAIPIPDITSAQYSGL